MDIKEFKQYTDNLDAYSADDVDNLTPMTEQELKNYQWEMDHDTGNLSSWDEARAYYTLKKQIAELKQVIDEQQKELDEWRKEFMAI